MATKQTLIQHLFEKCVFANNDEFKDYFIENIEKLLEAERKEKSDNFFNGYAEGLNCGKYSNIGKIG